MKDKILNDLPLKIISVIIAILIWYVVANVNDPVITKMYRDIPVQITNESYIAEGKKTYQVSEQYQSMAVYLTANRSVLQRIKTDHITVTANLREIVTMNTDPVYVPVKATCPGISTENIRTQSATIPIEIEDVDSAKFPISVDVGDTKPSKAYEIGKQATLPETITVSGPASLIKKISSIVARVDVSGMTESGTLKGNLLVIDKNLDELTETQMNFLTFDTGSRQVDVKIDLWRKQTGVKLRAEYSGTPAHGYQVAGITTTPEEITVAGSEDALQQLVRRGSKLVIPGDKINIDGQNKDTDITVDLQELVQGETEMKLSNSSTTMVTVHVLIMPNGSQEFQLDVDHIQTNNLSSRLSILYDRTQIPVRIKASDENLEKFDVSWIRASIDLSGKTAGDYEVPVKIELPENYELVSEDNTTTGEVQVTVHLKTKTNSNVARTSFWGK